MGLDRFFFNDTATTEIYTLSLHDALPISPCRSPRSHSEARGTGGCRWRSDRKSTRLNSSHDQISYAVFCLKKKNGAREDHRRRGGCAIQGFSAISREASACESLALRGQAG